MNILHIANNGRSYLSLKEGALTMANHLVCVEDPPEGLMAI